MSGSGAMQPLCLANCNVHSPPFSELRKVCSRVESPNGDFESRAAPRWAPSVRIYPLARLRFWHEPLPVRALRIPGKNVAGAERLQRHRIVQSREALNSGGRLPLKVGVDCENGAGTPIGRLPRSRRSHEVNHRKMARFYRRTDHAIPRQSARWYRRWYRSPKHQMNTENFGRPGGTRTPNQTVMSGRL